VADEKTVSQQLFDDLIKMLGKIRDAANQRGDTVTYGDADNANVLLYRFVDASRIENRPLWSLQGRQWRKPETLCESKNSAMTNIYSIPGSNNTLDETLARWLWPPDQPR
jgi:hypothetical protein